MDLWGAEDHENVASEKHHLRSTGFNFYGSVKRPVSTFSGVYTLKRIETTQHKLPLRKVNELWVSHYQAQMVHKEKRPSKMKQQQPKINLSVVRFM